LKPFNSDNTDSANFLQRLRRMGMPIRAMGSMMKTMRNIQNGMHQSWEDIDPYFNDLEPRPFVPKPHLWDDLTTFIAS
jgi:hypothetical protein